MKKTISLPNGYNGHTVKCFTDILEESANAVKLQVAEPGREYMFKWCWKSVYNKLMQAGMLKW
jgi:hypothetical protein